MKPLLTPGGWYEEKCVYWDFSAVGLNCVSMWRIDTLCYVE